MTTANRVVSKLMGPTVAVALVLLALLLGLDISLRFWYASSKAAGDTELTVTVGDLNGLTPKETGGSKSPDAIVIPHLGPGEYSLVLRGGGDGQTHFTIEPLTDGGSGFEYLGSSNMTSGGDWLLRLQVEVLDGLVKNVRAVSYGPAPSLAVSAGPEGSGGKTAGATPETIWARLFKVINGADGYVTDRWVTVGSFTLLALVLAAILRRH